MATKTGTSHCFQNSKASSLWFMRTHRRNKSNCGSTPIRYFIFSPSRSRYTPSRCVKESLSRLSQRQKNLKTSFSFLISSMSGLHVSCVGSTFCTAAQHKTRELVDPRFSCTSCGASTSKHFMSTLNSSRARSASTEIRGPRKTGGRKRGY